MWGTPVAAERRRAKISATIDPGLLDAVDAFVAQNPGADRSKVIDEALLLWYAGQQQKAMIEQFSEGSDVDSDEWAAWQSLRRAAAARRLAGPDSRP